MDKIMKKEREFMKQSKPTSILALIAIAAATILAIGFF
jgi:hypothetical protein